MYRLVTDIDQSVNFSQISDVRVGSEMVSDIYLRLLGRDSEVTSLKNMLHLVDLQDVGNKSAYVSVESERFYVG